MRYDFATLENGLQLVGEYSPEALSMAAGFFCRTGSRDETGPESGVSHFLEHMLFKGTATLDYDDINKTFDRIGAQYNAFTSEENTVYFGQVLPEYQGDIIGLLGQMMRPALRTTDFDMEKNVILEEIAMYEDRPLWVAHDHCRQRHYAGHPLGNSVLGSSASITALGRDQMADYFTRRYAADNLTFAMSGKYDWDAAVAQVTALCGAWEPQGATRALTAPSGGGGVEVVSTDRFKQVNLYVLCPGLSAQDPRRYVASAAAAAIGSGKASRLHWALVHPGKAEDASFYHDEEDQAGLFTGVLACDPDRAQEVLDIFRGELATACREGLREDEVKRAVRRFATGLVLQAETPLHRLISVGFDWTYRRAVTPISETAAQLEQITAADCNALLQELAFEPLSVVAVGPLEQLS
ncbi:MAG: insulinase family protein [Fimbriimonadaceae bacterium]|nr:insulinase family protein [Fimbriimonadaceae bacterium]